MAFNYVLIKNQSYSNQNKVIGLYATKSGVAKAVGSAIDKLYQNKSKKQADNCLLMDNIYFKGNSSFSIAYSKNGNGADLCFQ